MSMLQLRDKRIVITGAARRLGREFALACARHGADLVIHHAHSAAEADLLKSEVEKLGRIATVVRADLGSGTELQALINELESLQPLYALVNSAAIFEDIGPAETSSEAWERHLKINLTAPFLLSQAFARLISNRDGGHIVNILDWRALRPRADHFPYTITKSALAAMTRSFAVALAPRIRVNGLALGAVLPPKGVPPLASHLENVPLQRWPQLDEVNQALLFLLTENGFITGEILHVDGGRHLV
jgi:NAD(P)-dependent dehydrogenase (short-subunit alcohol dehydrogenase family)